jgi:hypothetical protein
MTMKLLDSDVASSPLAVLPDTEIFRKIRDGETALLEVLKTRLHRARAMIRRAVTERIGGVAAAAFQFHAPRCDCVLTAALAMIAQCP